MAIGPDYSVRPYAQSMSNDTSPVASSDLKDVQKMADNVDKKQWGIDIRYSISSGMRLLDQVVANNVQRQSNVENQFQDVLDETTNKDFNSAPEIRAARDGEANLKARLDKEHEEVTAQLAQIESEKVGGGVKAKLEDLSPNVLSAIKGGEGTSFELLSIPQDKSVTPEKTTFVRHSKNLYNQNTSIDNTILVSGGEVIPQTDVVEEDLRTTSDFIPVLGNTSYISNEEIYLQVYGEDKSPIGVVRDVNKDRPLTTVSLARYVRLSIRKSEKKTIQFEQGSVPTEYEPYGLIIKDLIVDDVYNVMTKENERWAI